MQDNYSREDLLNSALEQNSKLGLAHSLNNPNQNDTENKLAAVGNGVVQGGYDLFGYSGVLTNDALKATGLRNNKDHKATEKFFYDIMKNRPGVPESWQAYLAKAGNKHPNYSKGGEIASLGGIGTKAAQVFGNAAKVIAKQSGINSAKMAALEGAEKVVDISR